MQRARSDGIARLKGAGEERGGGGGGGGGGGSGISHGKGAFVRHNRPVRERPSPGTLQGAAFLNGARRAQVVERYPAVLLVCDSARDLRIERLAIALHARDSARRHAVVVRVLADKFANVR